MKTGFWMKQDWMRYLKGDGKLLQRCAKGGGEASGHCPATVMLHVAACGAQSMCSWNRVASSLLRLHGFGFAASLQSARRQ